MKEIKVPVDMSELNEAFEKAYRLVLLLREAKTLIGSLSGVVGQKSNDSSIASADADSSISCHE